MINKVISYLLKPLPNFNSLISDTAIKPLLFTSET
jgi:hypothetical protein